MHGITYPVPAWRVLASATPMPGRPHSKRLPLIGRQEELGLLLRSWDASKKGSGQVVLIQGEAGIGKSRLIEAMRAKIGGDYVWVVDAVLALSQQHDPLPRHRHLKRALGWRTEDDDASKLAKLEAALKTQSLALDRMVPLYAELLGLPLPPGRYAALQLTAQERREQTLDTLAGWLLDEAERKPVLNVWEDLHWADPTTLELLTSILSNRRLSR